MTSNDLRNGSERVAETLNLQDKSYKVIVNLQGDAPLTPIWVIEGLVKELEKSIYEVATPVLKCDQGTLNKLISDKKAGRIGATTVVFDKTGTITKGKLNVVEVSCFMSSTFFFLHV